MSGADLLKDVAEQYPKTIRFALSENIERGSVLSTVGNVHQYLAKPCPPDSFFKLLDNSVSLRDLLGDSNLQERIGRITSLPSPPEVYNRLVEELKSEEASLRNVAEIISRDVGLTVKILQMVNSAFFGLRTHVESPLHAVTLLGLDTIQSLVLSAGVINQFKAPVLPGFSLDGFHSRGLAVGTSARLLATAFGLHKRSTENALMAGLLHDVGKLVMLTHFQDEFVKAVSVASDNDWPLYVAEKEVLGVTDAQIGAYLLSLWGLPDPIIEAVALHYTPSQTPSPLMNVLTSVHLAFALNEDHEHKIRDDANSAVDMDYLQRLDLCEQLPGLRNLGLAAVQ